MLVSARRRDGVQPQGCEGAFVRTASAFATGVLTLTGPASVSAYQTALESIAFATTSSSTSPRTVSWTVNDGTLNSNAGRAAFAGGHQ